MRDVAGSRSTVGSSFGVDTRTDAMLRLVDRARQVAPTSYPVLIEGETGTGKEVFARGIHQCSARRGPFVAMNCSAIPETLFEAELFGAARGAYTGQHGERVGLFQEAHQGTLFLDEIGDLPGPVQAKLLRVLQGGEVRPLGSAKVVRVDVRVIAATHHSLTKMVHEGRFREDLYFRLSVARLELPALRDRLDDLPLLLELALEEAARNVGVPMPQVSQAALELMLRYAWPGNVRELQHVAAAAVLAVRGGTIMAEDLAFVRERLADPSALRRPADLPFFEALGEFERTYFEALLQRTGGNLSEAARHAQLSRTAIREKCRRYGLVGNEPGDESRPRRARSGKRMR
jgi:two-component system response regulator GlrR